MPDGLKFEIKAEALHEWRASVDNGGHDSDESELSAEPAQAIISGIPRLVTLSPVVWDTQTIEISTVRDGRRKVTVVADAEPWAGLPVWLAPKAGRPGLASLTQ